MIIHSCTPCPECPECPEDENTLTVGDTISEATFNTWVADWASNGVGYIDTAGLDYFTMPLVDITEFENNKNSDVKAARFVLGLDMTKMEPHIMLVGVDDEGKNILDPTRGQYIYDVTKPCPRLCGKSSLPD